MRLRLDAALVKKGLAASRSEATRLIDEGLVTVGGAFADKPARLVGPGEAIEVVRTSRYVSRGGEKLEAALATFEVDVAGRSVMDVGASTGGFTDCVLQHGARRVFAVDVGRHQLHERMRRDERVVSREGMNIRHVTRDVLPFACSLVVADLSFISLSKVTAQLVDCVSTEEAPDPASGGGAWRPQIIVLVKPQFEAGRRIVSRGRGVVTDPEVHREAVDGVRAAFEALGARVAGVIESPIKGGSGNTEFLMLVDVPDNS